MSQLRQEGLKDSLGSIVSFIDDDVYCVPTWTKAIRQSFTDETIVGVSGPTTITGEYRNNRDLFKFRLIKWIYDEIFMETDRPGHLSSCGANTTISNNPDCAYLGPVQYLEACNMSVRRDVAIRCGGFDPSYIGTGEWSEVDLALKMSEYGTLWFEPKCKLYHRPSKQGAYKLRLTTNHRWENFKLFQSRWTNPSLLRTLYRSFVWTYFRLKQMKLI